VGRVGIGVLGYILEHFVIEADEVVGRLSKDERILVRFDDPSV